VHAHILERVCEGVSWMEATQLGSTFGLLSGREGASLERLMYVQPVKKLSVFIEITSYYVLWSTFRIFISFSVVQKLNIKL
jgi:hypothetical protein